MVFAKEVSAVIAQQQRVAYIRSAVALRMQAPDIDRVEQQEAQAKLIALVAIATDFVVASSDLARDQVD